jgi:hypothetical protein
MSRAVQLFESVAPRPKGVIHNSKLLPDETIRGITGITFSPSSECDLIEALRHSRSKPSCTYYDRPAYSNSVRLVTTGDRQFCCAEDFVCAQQTSLVQKFGGEKDGSSYAQDRPRALLI